MYLENFTGRVTRDSTTSRLLGHREERLQIIRKTPVTGHRGGSGIVVSEWRNSINILTNTFKIEYADV